LNAELTTQNGGLHQRESEAVSKLNQKQQDLARLQESQRNFVDTISALEKQVKDMVEEQSHSKKAAASLSVQKNVLRVKLLCLERNNASTIKALNYLSGKYQTNEQKAKASSKKDALDLDKLEASCDESIKKPMRILRFRKAVICVLFANRLRRFGKESNRKLARNQAPLDFQMID